MTASDVDKLAQPEKTGAVLHDPDQDIDRDVAGFLSEPSTHALRDGVDVKRVDTHAAVVFLAGKKAYKIKKPVDLGYLDFSTLEKRRCALERELELNQAIAPHIYHHVRPIRRDAQGGLSFAGEGPIVDYVLEMLRFDETRVMADMARRASLPSHIAAEAAATAAAFHAKAEPVADAGGADGVAQVLKINRDALARLSPKVFKPALLEEFNARIEARFQELKPLLEARREAGLVRHCHGDMHLGNFYEDGGKAVLFDRLEFDDRLAKIDVLYDFAFLLMDLKSRKLDAAAARAFNAYFEALPFDDWRLNLRGLGALPFFMSIRASIRAHVIASQALQIIDDLQGGVRRAGLLDQARDYLRHAVACLDLTKPRLLAIGGFSGTGKSTAAIGLAPTIGRPMGALLIRTDVVRKKSMDAPLFEKLGPKGYTAEQNKKVYDAIFDGARAALESGVTVILDAVFAKPAHRARAEQCARDAKVPFKGFWLMAKEGVLKARLHTRQNDASDANSDVLEEQLAFDTGEIGWTKMITTEVSTEKLVDAIRQVLGR